MLLGNDPKPLIIPQAAYGLINNNEVQPQTPLLAKTSYFSPQTESDVNSAQIISNLSTDNHQSDPISTNSPTSNPSSPQHPPQKLYQPPTDLPPISK